MNDILQRAEQDLEALETMARDARADAERFEEEANEQREFVNKLRRYYGMTFVPIEKPTVQITFKKRRTVKRVPRAGSTRWRIGTEALAAIKKHGQMSTIDLLPHISVQNFIGTENPRAYLSNALSKDARLDADSNGWKPADHAIWSALDSE